MRGSARLAALALGALLFSCATPGPPPRARIAVELLQGFPASASPRPEDFDPPGEHVVVLVDATTSMQAADDAARESHARAAAAAASRLLGALGPDASVDVWTLGAGGEECVPARRGLPSVSADGAAEGSLAAALDAIATQLEIAPADGATGLSAPRTRIAVFTDLGDECGGDLCGAVGRLVAEGARLELSIFGEGAPPPCFAELAIVDTSAPPEYVRARRSGPARFWVEAAGAQQRIGEGVLAAGRADGDPRTVPAGRAYVYVELDVPTRFGPVDLAPDTETRLRILDFPGLRPAVREWSWKTRDVSPPPETPASIAP